MRKLACLAVLQIIVLLGVSSANPAETATGTKPAAPAASAQPVAPVTSVYGMVKAFDEAKGFVPVKDWRAHNAQQREFVRDFLKLGGEAGKLPASMLQAIASDNADVINKFLAKNGLSLKLPPFGRGDFGAAAVLSIEGKWAAAATELKDADGKKYPAVALPGCDFYQVPGHNQGPVVRIYKSKEFNVYVTPWDGDDEGFNAVKAARDLTPDATTPVDPANYTRMVMPMIDLNRSVSLDWLQGMTGNGYTVREARCQTILKLDEHGFSVKDGFVFRASRSIPKTYVLNKPFLLWVEVPGSTYPVFASKVDPKYWSRPK